MATRLITTFKNLHAVVYAISIDDANYAGAAIEATTFSPGFTLRYEGRDPLDALNGSTVRIPFVVESHTQSVIESIAEDILSAPEGRFTIKIEKSGELYWVGYVLADFSGFEDMDAPYVYSISGADGLARLRDIAYRDDGEDPPVPYGVEPFLSTILRILNKGPIASEYFDPSTDIFLRTSVNWVDGTIGAPAAAKCPLRYSRVNGTYVYASKRDNETEYKFKTYYEVLKMILEHWQCSIRFSNGCWRIQQAVMRENDLFFERRFSADGTLISSTANAGYDIEITQGARVRLNGGIFGYIQPLNNVEAIYEHNTGIINYIENKGQRWYSDAPNTTPLILSNIETDGTNYFKVSGTLIVQVEAANTTPWRWVHGMIIKKGGEYVESLTFSPSNGAGGYLQVVNRTVVDWTSPDETYYEISSGFTTQNLINQSINFSFETSIAPTAGDEIEIDFIPIEGRKLNNTTQSGVTTHHWYIKNQVFEILSTDPTKNENVKTVYTAENPEAGNTQEVSYKMLFGHAFAAWTQVKIQTTADLSTWVDTTDNWKRGTNFGDLEFGELWVQQRLSFNAAPVLTWKGEIYAIGVEAHTRIVFTDDTPYCLISGEYNAHTAVWSGEWVRIGTNEVGVVVVKKYDGPGISVFPGTAGSGGPVGIVSLGTGMPGLSGAVEMALAALSNNYVGSTISAGSVSTVNLEYAVSGNSYLSGDEIIIYDPNGLAITTLTITSTAASGATSLSVSGTADVDIPAGAYILYSPLNHYTTSGGGGISVILPTGTDTQTLRYSGTTLTANSALTNDGTYLGVGGAPSTSYMVRVKQNASTKGLFVERDSGSTGAHIYHNGTAWFESVGGFNAGIKSASGAIISLVPGGGAGQIRQVSVAPGANVTSVENNASILGLNTTFAPTAAGGDFSIFNAEATINQTGSANGVTRGLKIAPSLTAVAVVFRGIHYIPSTQVFLFQDAGTGVVSHLIGNLGIGTGTTSPGAKIDVVGNGTTSSTFGLKVSNSTPTIIFCVRDDQRVGILTTSPALTLDAIAATDGIGLPTGTTAQRPSVNGAIRINSTVGGLEIRNGGAWNRITCTTTPTIAAGAAAGTGPTVTVDSGNDLCHQVTVITGTSPTTGTLCTVTFNQALDAGLFTFVVFSPRNAATAGEIAKFYVGSTGNSSYTISCAAAPTASTTYIFHVMAKQ